MHPNSMVIMKEFVEKYKIKSETVVDVGSYDINGTYKSLFPEAKYIGADNTLGPNVDVIMDSPEWDELSDVDYVISGQTLEHVADIPKLMASIFRVLKSGGILCMIVPSEGPRHDYPIWVGNFSKERMTECVESAGFEVIDCIISPVPPFNDNCCVARKPEKVEIKQKTAKRKDYDETE